jgi:GT2 family glycosyltransferase
VLLARRIQREGGPGAYRLLVLENGSGPEDVEALSRGLPEPASLIVSPANRGFAGGVNALLAHARSEWVLLLNPDVVPEEGLFGAIPASVPDRPEVALVGGVRIGPGPRSHGRFPGLLDRLRAAGSDAASGDRPEGGRRPPAGPSGPLPEPVDWVSACFMIARLDLLRELSGFDEGYFMQLEDVDLCWRARRAGFIVEVDPRLRFRHEGHLSYRRSGRDLEGDYRRSRRRFLARRTGWWAGLAYHVMARAAAALRGAGRRPKAAGGPVGPASGRH